MSQAESFAGRLRELREQATLTQQQLADKAGLKLGAIRDLEQGRHGPTWETVLALGEALDVECNAFTQPPEQRHPPGRGRPAKAKDESPAPKRPPGRPRKRSK